MFPKMEGENVVDVDDMSPRQAFVLSVLLVGFFVGLLVAGVLDIFIIPALR
jgi:hypothetical protein